MVKLITFLLAFSISAFAEDYEIFNSLEGDLEVNKAISSQFEEENLNIKINTNEKKYCEGYASVIREEELERDNVGCFDANSTLQTLQYKKLDTVLKSSSFLIPKGNPIFSFDNLEIIWDEKGRKKFITIDIRTSIKQIYTKYSSNIERFIVARKNRLKDFKLLDEHTGILSWSSSKSSYCKDEAEKLEKDIKCWATYKYYYNNKDAKENGEIELNKNHSGIPIEYEIRVDNDTNYESFHNPEGTYIVSFENWWDAATEKKIKVSVRCLNCIDKQFKTKEIVIRNYFPKKVLKDGGGYDGTDSWKDEYGYGNDFYRNGLIQEEKNKYNKQEDLRKAPIKGLNEQKRSEKINDLKKQCKEIGYVPGSKKFKDCVLELL